MNITHICLCGPVTDNFSYQENLLTKYHAKSGNNVSIITSKWIWSEKGKLIKTDHDQYTNKDDVKVYRLDLIGSDNFTKKFKKFKKVYSTLSLTNPDIIFIHGVQFLDIKTIANYKKEHPQVKIFVDNHADFSNSATNWASKKILHGIVWKYCAKIIEPLTEMFYGVLPARVDFLINEYKLDRNKIKLLPLGADDEFVDRYNSEQVKLKVKQELNLNPDNFIIVTGGKIDESKKQTLLLMKAVCQLNSMNVKLIIFGSVSSELKKEFDEISTHDNIIYLGWLSTEESYKYFAIADLVIFPGRHSVFWEQVVCLGIPMIVKYWEGTTHIDIGGNVIYIKEGSIQEIRSMIEELLHNKKKFEMMKVQAQATQKNMFLYSSIAKRSIEIERNPL